MTFSKQAAVISQVKFMPAIQLFSRLQLVAAMHISAKQLQARHATDEVLIADLAKHTLYI